MSRSSGFGYRPRPTPLHAARAGATAGYCAALGLVATLFDHPLILVATLAAVCLAGVATGAGRELRRAVRLGLPLALLVVLVNPLVSQQGETLLVRGYTVLGRPLDITLEAFAYGGVAALRVLALVLTGALFTAVVDPDELLRLLRRVSFRSALTAALAARLVPVLLRDAARMSDAARCRPRAPRRGAVARAAVRGALDRSVDLAAALEVGGFATAARPRRRRRAWSRHDRSVAATAIALAGGGLAARLGGVGAFAPYPAFDAALGPAEWVLAGAVIALSVAPFAAPRARLGVARA